MTIVFLTALATWLLLFPTRAILRRFGIVDRPNARSSHAVPTIRGGGVAIVLVLAGWNAWLAWHSGGTELFWLLGAFLGLAVVSFVDDLRGLRPSLRFLTQAATAAIAVVAIVSLTQGQVSLLPLSGSALLLGAIAWLWVAGYTNAFNFMDGINGLAGMQAVVTGVGTAFIAMRLNVAGSNPAVILSLAAAGAALGFLPHNFPRARVFMGDVSSAALGFLLAVLAFWVARLTEPWVLFWIALLHANFVLDTGITLVRRAWRGDRLHEAHREHFYQRLIRAGNSHNTVTIIEAVLQVIVVVALCWATPAAWNVKLAIGSGVIALWCVFFGAAEIVFRRRGSEVDRKEHHAGRIETTGR